MKNTAYDYLMSGAYMRDGVYTIWYRTYRQSSSRSLVQTAAREDHSRCGELANTRHVEGGAAL